jgi:hypothetical protein
VRGESRADEGGAERRQRQRERRRVQLPDELERGRRLGEPAGGEREPDLQDVDKHEDGRQRRAGGRGEARPFGARRAAPLHEAVQARHENEQQRQVQRHQTGRDRDRVAVGRVVGQHFLDRSAEGRRARSRQHRVFHHHRHRDRDRRGADEPASNEPIVGWRGGGVLR